MQEPRPHGYTCVRCPSRGYKGVEDDWVSYTRTKGDKKGWNRSLNLSWPVRCRTCDTRYKSFKRAREAVMRLELIRKTYSEFGGAKWKYLKFATITWPIELSDNPMPDIKKMKSVWVQARNELIKSLGILGGTDVIECVTKEIEVERPGEPTVSAWSHNIHIHSIWLAPYVKLENLQKSMKDAGIGRHEYTILKEQEWTDEYGEDRIQTQTSYAIDYLSKYLTKCAGQKRMVWGELRSWKDYLSDDDCRICIKTTHDLRKEYPCQCETETRATAEASEDS